MRRYTYCRERLPGPNQTCLRGARSRMGSTEMTPRIPSSWGGDPNCARLRGDHSRTRVRAVRMCGFVTGSAGSKHRHIYVFQRNDQRTAAVRSRPRSGFVLRRAAGVLVSVSRYERGLRAQFIRKDEAMLVHVVMHGEIAVVETRTLSDNALVELETIIRREVAEGRKKILVDLGRTNYMNSRGIGTLTGLQANAFRHGASLYLCNVDHRIHNLLVIMWLTRVLNVLGTRQDALEFLAKLDVDMEDRQTPSPHRPGRKAQHDSGIHVDESRCHGDRATAHAGRGRSGHGPGA